jgi:hypothetical protein
MAIKHTKTSAKVDGADSSLIQPSDWNASHTNPFKVVTVGETLAESDPVLAFVSSVQTFNLPVSVSPGAHFALRNSASSTAAVFVSPGVGRTITLSPSNTLAQASSLSINPGELVQLVALSSTVFEVSDRSGGMPFVFTQTSPADTWVINHNLGRHPCPVVTGDGGAQMWAEVVNLSVNQLMVYFDAPTTGQVHCF